jgi:hypothetical protein
MPRQRRQATRRCDSPVMSTTTVATMAEMKKARSIWTFVKRMNHLLRVPCLSSPVDSAQPTLPAGYSPPMPFVRQSVIVLSLSPYLSNTPSNNTKRETNSPMPKKNRYATNAASNPPGLPPAPYAPAPSAAKTRIIIVDANSDHLREKWSDVYPKNSMPTTVPANVMLATFACADEVA